MRSAAARVGGVPRRSIGARGATPLDKRREPDLDGPHHDRPGREN
jgi:hypothetical protein